MQKVGAREFRHVWFSYQGGIDPLISFGLYYYKTFHYKVYMKVAIFKES